MTEDKVDVKPLKRLPRNVRRQRDKKFRDWRTEGRLSRRPVGGEQRNTLAKVNDALAAEGRTLHPTKGFRKISVKRSFASVVVDNVRKGIMHFEVQQLKLLLKRAGER